MSVTGTCCRIMGLYLGMLPLPFSCFLTGSIFCCCVHSDSISVWKVTHFYHHLYLDQYQRDVCVLCENLANCTCNFFLLHAVLNCVFILLSMSVSLFTAFQFFLESLKMENQFRKQGAWIGRGSHSFWNYYSTRRSSNILRHWSLHFLTC